MDSSEEIEIPIEAFQEYITTALKFAPLNLSDKIYNIFIDNLDSLVNNVVDQIYSKYGEYLSANKSDSLKKMLKIKLQGQMNVLFDQFENFMITNVFNIDDNAVLPEDMPQTTYSKKKHEWIKTNIKKHEEQIFLLKSAEERADEELSSIKILQNDLNVATSEVENAVKRLFGDTTIRDVCDFVENLKKSRRRSDSP
ncbi:unnamed protein product [Hymenolepis diminuta]|uniref:Protein MIS12 homolog n=1 Tax=Hymenolepis diminuta TaxID=6216 RepID=A0A564YZM1_HYMDI|nr:unnamed protein product [Hymenolepis diminuta]